MTKTRKPRRDSAAAIAQELLDRAAGPIPVPNHIALPRPARVFWNAIIASRPRASWRAVEMPLVAALSRTMASIAATQATTPMGARDHRGLTVLVRRQGQLLRALRLAGHQRLRAPKLPSIAADDHDLLSL